MKKISLHIIMLLAMMLVPGVSHAVVDHGGPSSMWTVPAVFSVDQEVTFYFDMTDSGFKEGVDLYLWCWNPSEPDAGNWEHSSDFAKLTYEGDNIYSMTIVPTEYFSGGVTGKTAQEIYDYCQTDDWPGFWARLKTFDGEEESDVFQAPDSRSEWKEIQGKSDDFFIYSGIKATGFSDLFKLNQPMTMLFDGDKFTVGGVTMNEFAKKDGFGGFKLHSGLNDWTYLQGVKVWIPGCMEKTNIQKLSNGYWSISMTTPLDYWGWQYADDGSIQSNNLEIDSDVENLAWLVVGIINGDWGGTCPDHSSKAGTATPYPDPQFSTFPSRISAKDILTLTRQYNERTAGELKYVITAGTKTISGVMPGVRDKRTATVNLTDELAGVNAGELTVVIQKEDGTQVEEKTIQLLTIDE